MFANIPILVRAALNVPIENEKIVDNYRLRRVVQTIRFLAERRAKVVIISHIGEQGTETLAPVAAALGRLVSNVSFCPTTVDIQARAAIRALAPGHVLVLENLRRNKGELHNDTAFARDLAALADIFVQDSFDTCHRLHASIIGVPKFLPSYAGLLIEEEIRELSRAIKPAHPALAIIGGAKFSTKEAMLTAFLKTYDHVFVGGALANDFLKASGVRIGTSRVSGTNDTLLRRLLVNPKLALPIDSLVVPADKVELPDARTYARIAALGQIQDDEVIIDHGPGTSTLLEHLVQKAKTVLWNGPLGIYERGFVDTTDTLARAIAASNAHSVVGGGDTAASIANLGLLSRFSFVSTGGGAMLDYLAKGTLPGIMALN